MNRDIATSTNETKRNGAREAADAPPATPSGVPAPDSGAFSNDAFAFWKLPEKWREALGSAIVKSREEAEWYLFERYRPSLSDQQSRSIQAYYALKPLLPARLRQTVRSVAVRMSSPPLFPAWPYESALLKLRSEWLEGALATLGQSDMWHIGFWPDGRNCCVVLTHDVEGPLGLKRMEAMADLEEKFGFRSAWNIPLDQYPVDWRIVERLRARGFEFGAHGLRHDGRLFRSHKDFSELAPKLETLAREHQMRGFRSPSTLRHIDWLCTLDFDFDSTMADSEPFEPQPGGSCSIFPFFLKRRMAELPYTLPQDHTLINLLRRDPLPVWLAKVEWIAERGGMILTLTHPDYSGDAANLHKYEQLLNRLDDLEHAWRALPSEVAAWWRKRAALKLVEGPDAPRLSGGDDYRVVVKRVSAEPMSRGRLLCSES
jgi:peptidoglycan/xylan/chitin deacetylase (PgdA/CDA1 family)